MSLLNKGYWHENYWLDDYWDPNYWQKYGEVPGIKWFTVPEKKLNLVGDTKQVDFYPQCKLMRWNAEENKVSFKPEPKNLGFYPIGRKHIFEVE